MTTLVISDKSMSVSGVYVYIDGNPLIATNAHIYRKTDQFLVGFLNDVDDVRFVTGNLIFEDKIKDVALLDITFGLNKTLPLLRKVFKGQSINRLLKLSTIDGDYENYDGIDVFEPNSNNMRFIGERSFANSNDILPGRRVFFMGFPLGIGSKTMDPVVRSGMIATIPHEGIFYIDAMINQGNSGSPVFIQKLNKNADMMKGIDLYEWELVGIITGYQPEKINMKLGLKTIDVPYNSGLASVVSIQEIKKLYYDHKK
ncbi:MAG: hypothetical protein A2901_07980 [Elusimicrobia bacterium RIFCSPLOWO2_01_FULL_54_10]|nr:MAG: hypothetical protein A2901_07980 [Elusimicrobia bacterium RIFCSPLOWO2_01_FULL_54_10]